MADWTAQENEAVVAEYLAMLGQQLAGQSYQKSRFNQRVQTLTGRGRGSVEYKFQNVSAALQDLRAPWINGYKPAKNYQAALAEVVADQLATRPQLLALMRERAEAPALPRMDVDWNVVEPPAGTSFGRGRAPVVLHTDFVALEAANRSLGASGEALVAAREKQVLIAAGQPDLAAEVEHVSATRGDGLGYDIRSFTPAGTERLIEVKTTRRDELWPMFVSRNEVAVSRDLRDSYVLARVFDFARPRVGLYELQGAIEETCQLDPESWRALPRVS